VSNAETVVLIPDADLDDRRAAALERLLIRSLSEDGFDWDVLSRLDEDAWGVNDDGDD
jgi:hypothetical protein